jgi:hypothetical protein
MLPPFSELNDENLLFVKTCSGRTRGKLSNDLACVLSLFLSYVGRTVLFMGNRVFSKAEVYDPLEKALEAGCGKRHFLTHFYTKNDQSTKTGSGQM